MILSPSAPWSVSTIILVNLEINLINEIGPIDFSRGNLEVTIKDLVSVTLTVTSYKIIPISTHSHHPLVLYMFRSAKALFKSLFGNQSPGHPLFRNSMAYIIFSQPKGWSWFHHSTSSLTSPSLCSWSPCLPGCLALHLQCPSSKVRSRYRPALFPVGHRHYSDHRIVWFRRFTLRSAFFVWARSTALPKVRSCSEFEAGLFGTSTCAVKSYANFLHILRGAGTSCYVFHGEIWTLPLLKL